MIQDARVLQDDFIPGEVEHRDAEVNALSRALQPLLDGEPAETALLYGPSGTGKTCLAQFTVDRLRERVLDIEHQYVNCWQNYTRFRALYRILEGIGETLDVHRQSTPKDELLARLEAYDGPPYVVVLDEVDQLQDEALLYDLYTVRNVEMVLIANREEAFFAGLGSRLRSRLQSARRIHFDTYSVEELVAILEARVEWGLAPDVIDRERLATIADAAAGDARVAIGILRNAARAADRDGAGAITEAHVAAAIEPARAAIQRTNLEKLTPDQRTLYEILEDRGEVAPGELYAAYAERVEDPKTDRTVRNYLRKLEQYGLVESEGEKRGRVYRVAASG